MPKMRHQIASLLLRARRSGLRPPESMRWVAHKLMQSLLSAQSPVDPWTTTLVGGQPLGPMPAALAVPASPIAPQTGAGCARRVKCLIVTGILDAGGSDEVVAFLARHLPHFGIDTMVGHTGAIVAGSTTGGRVPRLLASEGIEVAEVREEDAELLLEKWRPDVISAHVPPPCWLRAARRRGVPFIETLHGMHGLYGAGRTAEESRSEHVWGFVAVSNLVRRQYLEMNPRLAGDRISTVPNSVDLDRMRLPSRASARRWLNLSNNDFLFVSHSRLALQKNSYALVDAFGEFAAINPRVHLLLAGRCDDVAYARQVLDLRDSLPCGDRIHLRDHVGWPGAILAAADAFVLASFFEGWSLASMEALCAGLPVIMSDVGGAREQIGEARRGILIDNPLGNPMAVDWDRIRSVLYTPQANRRQLLDAFEDIYEDRADWSDRRESLRRESLERFHPDSSLAGHARLLRCAAEESHGLRSNKGLVDLGQGR
ncbi:glycosyltransferase family 4 protein [Devosia geojensis]|uniref:glycosyltransferase family 4 protein n=1 Tax=Devosia geojensis TaxID=443610 RepID=UPI000695D0EF|nr:glycosyltransferase family 4 protein [Devosia geojensis]